MSGRGVGLSLSPGAAVGRGRGAGRGASSRPRSPGTDRHQSGEPAAGLQQLNTRQHKKQGKPVTAEFKPSSTAKQEPPPLEFEDEEGPTKIEASNVPDVSAEALQMFFEGPKGGGCAGAVSDVTKISSGVFHVTFHDPKVAAQVVSEKRIFKKVTLQLSFVKEASKTEPSEDLNQIEVSNVPDSVTKEALQTYFEMPNSGGCADAVAECTKIGPGKFYVTFRDPKVAAKVMDKESHKFKKAILQLRFVHQEKNDVQEYKLNQLAIHDLPEGMKKDVVVVVIENRLEKEEEDDFDVEISGQSAIITFTKDYSIDELQQMKTALSSEPVKGASVTVEMCKALKPSIHIRNITTQCDEEFLEFYFSKPKRSGGGEVESIKILSDNEAIVTFSDPAVIPSVLGRQHRALGGTALLQEVREDTPPPLAQSPISSPPMEPLKVPIDPLLMQSLNRSPSGLEQSIMGSNVMFSPDEKAGVVVLSPTKQSKSNWQEECQEKVSTYISSNLTKEEINVPKEAAAQAMSAVVKLEKENPSFIVVPNSDGTVITVAGELSSVSQAKESIKHICSALITDTASVVLSPEDYDFVQQMKMSELPANIECTFDPSTFKILLKGPIGDVSQFKESIGSFIQHVDIPVMLEPQVTEFFKTENGKGKLETFLQERQCQAALHFNPHPNLTLHLLCRSEDATSVRAAMHALPLVVTSQAIPIPDAVAPILSDLEDFDQLCQKVEKEHGVLIKHVGREISAAGFKAEVTSSLTEIDRFLKEKASPLPPAEVSVGSLIAKVLHNSQRGIEKHLQSFHVQLQIDTAAGVIQFSPMHFLKPGWEESCKSSISKYIQANIAQRKVQVPQNAYSDVMSVLYDSQQDDSTFVFNYPPNGTTLAFAGDKRTVKSTEDRIAQLCTSYSYKSEEMVLDPENFEFLYHLKMPDLIGKYRSVEIEPQPETHSLLLSGTVKAVKAVKEYVPLLVTHITIPVKLKPAVVKYFVTENGKEKLYGFLRQKRCDKCATYISESPMKLLLLCAPKYKKNAEAAAEALQESTCVVPFQIPDLLLPFLPELPDFTKETKSLERHHSVQILIEGKEILVTGFKDGVSTSIDILSAFIKQKVLHFQPVRVPMDPLIAKCIDSNPTGLHACMANIQVKCTMKTEQSSATALLSPTKATKSEWKEECQSALTSYTEANYSREEIEVPKPAAGEVFQLLMKTSNENVFQFQLCNDGSRAIVAGEKNVVQAVQASISNICNKHQITETIKLNRREYDFFTQIVQPQLTARVTIECVPAKHSVEIGGSISEVTEMKNSMKAMVQHSIVPVVVEAMLVEFFTTGGKQDLTSYVQKNGFQVALHSIMSVHPPSLEFLCDPKLESHLQDLARKIPEETQVSVISLPESLVTTSIAQEFAEHCKQLETQFRVSIKTNENELRVCGFRKPVIDAKKSLESFIKKKCSTKKSYSIPTGMWRLFSGPMKPQWMKIEVQCQGSEVELTAPVKEEGKFSIFLKGDKVEVHKICQAITQLTQTVATAVVPLLRPDLIKYFSEGEKGKMMIPGIENEHKVCIEVVDVGEEREMKQTAARSITHGGAPRLVKECKAEVVNMKQISIYTGDITEFRADVIVNAANEDLKHIGGVADAILKKGGQVIQQDCDRYVRAHGQLNPGQVWMSTVVGNLPCLALIHAVGPRWYNNPSNRQQLQRVCMSCFKEAKVYNSIALPAISSGVFGCPIDQCANVLISAAVNFCKTPHSGNLHEINFVLFKKTDVPVFIKALEDHLPPQNIRRRSKSSAWESSIGASYSTSSFVASSATPYSASAGEESYEEEEEEEEEEYEDEPLIQSSVSPLNRVFVQQGSILDVEAEIYVNSTNGNMDLSGGAVAQALAKAAGPALQAECNKKAPIGAGEIAVTGPGNILRCKCILHINCPGYDKSGGQAEDVLRTIIHKCMKECDKKGASTIVFPAIGTGNLGFPYEVAAHIMVDEVYNYLMKNKCKSLSMVYFIIFMEKMYRSFCEEVEKRKQNPGPVPQPRKVKRSSKPKKSKPQNQQYRGRREEHHGLTQQRYRGQRNWPNESPETTRVTRQGDAHDLGNHLTVEVLKGDITKETADAIVNPTNREMRLEGRGVAAALLKKAGQDLQKACDEVRAKGEYLSEGKVIDTRPGKLKCKRVFHIVFQSNDKKMFTTVIRSCIERAIQLNFTSIAFPAIGTGMQGFPAAEAAKGTMKALQQCHSPSALSVRIVLFQDDVCSAFKMAFDDQAGDQSGWLQKVGRAVWSIVPSMPWFSSDTRVEEEEEEEKMEGVEGEPAKEIELRVYGETEENVKNADDSLHKLINMQFKTDDFEDDKIAMLSRAQERTLREEARRLQLVFDIDRALKYIQLKGSKESISEMKLKIVEILNQVEKEASRKQHAETVMKVVQWKRMDSSETPYDPVTNLEIEEAHNAGQPRYVFKHGAESFTIDFKKMEEIDHAMNNQTCKVRRIAEGAEGEGGLPDDWEPMIDPNSGKPVSLRVIDLPNTSKGYQLALAEFHKTMSQGKNYTAIVKIQRIQNPAMYGQYIAKKKQLDTQNPQGFQNERWLFHGTSSTAVPQINQTNFNRSFRGQNGTVYGQGTYFARDASYSNNYAQTDAQGLNHMYVVRVLTGEYTRGNSSMLVAPPKDPKDPAVLFDSVVDNTSDPSIYVLFYDGDAYPEYLIVYK